jgi:RNA recognition motif-containing protein
VEGGFAQYAPIGQTMRPFVHNFPYHCQDSDVAALFEPYGNVLDVRFAKKEGRFLGFGWVVMRTESDAQFAVTHLHKTPFKGRTLLVERARPPRLDKAWDTA